MSNIKNNLDRLVGVRFRQSEFNKLFLAAKLRKITLTAFIKLCIKKARPDILK